MDTTSSKNSLVTPTRVVFIKDINSSEKTEESLTQPEPLPQNQHARNKHRKNSFWTLDRSWEWEVSICNIVEQSGTHNFQGCKIQLDSKLKFDMFEIFLRFYHDKEVVQFLRYSWPISFYGELDLCPDIVINNHQGAKDHMQAIRSYITKELNNGSVLGPF